MARMILFGFIGSESNLQRLLSGLVRDEDFPALARVADDEVVFGVAEAAVDAVRADGDARFDEEAVELRLDAQQGLAHGLPGPGGRAREPAVLALAGLFGILAGHHLAEDVRLDLAELLVLREGGRNLLVVPAAPMITQGLLWQKMPAFSL